jgi:hypothetical protein
MTHQDVKDYSIYEEQLDEMIVDSHPDNGGHRGIYTFLLDMRQMCFGWRSHINFILCRVKNSHQTVNSEDDEEYQAYLDRKASGLEAVWNVLEEEE